MMPKEPIIEVTGKVNEVQTAGHFKVELETGQIINCTLSGNMRRNRIRLTIGDRVKVEMTPYDLSRGRIEHRL